MLSFFPRLDSSEANPRVLLDGMDVTNGEPVRLRFIYYNGKLHGTSTRNEYRVTGLTQFLQANNAQIGDEIHFTRIDGDRIGIRIVPQAIADTPEVVETEMSKIKLTGNWSTYRRNRQ